jgi:hypothetical protein
MVRTLRFRLMAAFLALGSVITRTPASADAVTFTFDRLQALDTQGHSTSTFRVDQPVTLQAQYSVSNAQGSVPLTVDRTLSVKDSAGWEAVNFSRTQLDAVNGVHSYRSAFTVRAGVLSLRVVVAMTVASQTRRRSIILYGAPSPPTFHFSFDNLQALDATGAGRTSFRKGDRVTLKEVWTTYHLNGHATAWIYTSYGTPNGQGGWIYGQPNSDPVPTFNGLNPPHQPSFPLAKDFPYNHLKVKVTIKIKGQTHQRSLQLALSSP